MENDDEENYIGYCNPPKRSQFRSGRSGNPYGRPKKSLNPKQVFINSMNEKIFVLEAGKKRKVTTIEALFKTIRKSALNGDKTSIKLIFDLIHKFKIEDVQSECPQVVIIDDITHGERID